MQDFILAVDDPVSWHAANLKLNPQHYSFLRYGREGSVAALQENWGAKVYFNTLVPTHEGVSFLFPIFGKLVVLSTCIFSTD